LASGIRFGFDQTGLISLFVLVNTALLLLVTAPVAIMAVIHLRRSWRVLLLPAALFLGSSICVIVPVALGLNRVFAFDYNLVGKILSVNRMLVVMALYPRLNAQRIGLGAPNQPGWLVPMLVMTVALGIISVLLANIGGADASHLGGKSGFIQRHARHNRR
jgi:hypothetical protein